MKTERLHLRVDSALKGEMQAYAKRHKTTLSALVTQVFVMLLLKEQQAREQEAPQV